MNPQQPARSERAAPQEFDSGGELSLSTTFELLKNGRRRETISYLIGHDGRSTLSDLAEHIAALENGIEIRQLSSDQRKRVYIGLYQCHLPKLDKAGVIDFDKNRGTVLLRESVADQLVPYLEPEPPGSAAAPDGASGPAPTAVVDSFGEHGTTAAITAAVGFLVALLLLPVLGAATAVPLGVGVVFGAVLFLGVRAVRGRVDVGTAPARD